MGTNDILLGGNPAMDKHLVQGGVAILLGLLHATETGNKLRLCGPLVRVRLYLPYTKIGEVGKLILSYIKTEFRI